MESNITSLTVQKLKEGKKPGKPEQYLLENFDDFVPSLGIDLEKTAKETKAIQRKREIRSAKDLLRLILFYAVSDWSLRLTGAWALLSKIGYLSDVAILKRFRKSRAWLGELIGLIIRRRLSALTSLPGFRMRVIDATVISKPGSKGIDWRVHLSFDLGNLCLDGIEITDKYGGESLARFEARNNEIYVADGGYPFAAGMEPVLTSGASLIVRINWRNVPVLWPNGQRFDIIAWLKTLTGLSETLIWMKMPTGWFQFRLIAAPMPPDKAEEARRRARLRSRKKQHPLNENTILAAGYVILLTNLPAETWSGRLILALYRMRWQIELAIKRLKSLIHIDHLRAKDPQLAQTYLLAKLLVALLIDEMTTQLGFQQEDWFDSVDRPISISRTTTFFYAAFRQIIAGIWFCNLDQFLLIMRRYFCDPPRQRPQQLAYARALIQHLSMSGIFP